MSWSIRTTLFAFLTLCMAVVAPQPLLANCALKRVAELPIDMEGRRPTISVKFNGHDARLMLDSGAFFSIISGAAAAEYSLKLTPAPFGLRVTGVGGYAETSLTTVKDFGMIGLTLHNVEFLVGGTEAGSSGLLGQNLLGGFDDEYDLAHGAVRLYRSEGCGKSVLAYWLTPGQDFSMLNIERIDRSDPHTVGDATLNGKPIRVMFDTGADASVLSLKAAARAGVTPNSAGVVEAGYSFGIGRGATKTYLARFDSFRIGDGEEIKNTRLRIGDIGLADIDMLLGADFFLSHRIFISNKEHRAFISFNGGSVFNLSQGAASAPPPATPSTEVASAPAQGTQAAELSGSAAPTDAAGFARRGEGFDARRDFAHALADLSKACEMRPDEPEYFYRRALVYVQTDEVAAARSDLDQVIKLKQDFLPAYIPRAEIHLAEKDEASAKADLAAVDRLAPKQADLRLELGSVYEKMGEAAAAISQFDQWIDSHPQDARLVGALSSRCMMRVRQNQELNLALDDCSKALRRADRRDPNNAVLYAHHGMVRLRQGEYDKAIGDFNDALKLQPKSALALFGRGVAESRKNQAAAAAADIAAAHELEPKLQARYLRIGIAP